MLASAMLAFRFATLGAWHFKLQVHVAWTGHELRVRQLIKDGVILTLEVKNHEGHGLFAVILVVTEHD